MFFKKNFHTCKEKCKLCEHERGHPYTHENNELICNKCKKEKCKVSLKGHLYGGQHNCKEDCKNDGTCVIEGFVKQEDRIYIICQIKFIIQ